MSVVGNQDFWTVGARFLFKRDDVDGVAQPWIDFGTMAAVNPALNPERITLQDPETGVKRLVDEAIVGYEETYEFTCNNFNNISLSLLFMGKPPKTFTQAVAHKRVMTPFFTGNLAKVVDSDTAGTTMFALGAIAGVVSTVTFNAGALSTGVVTTIDVATKTITLAAGPLATDFVVGNKFVVEGTGLANVANATTYTVVSSSGGGGSPLAIIVSETPAANEAAITGSAIYKKAADTGKVYSLGTDWEVVSLDRGIVRAKPSPGTIVTGSLGIIYSTALHTGLYLLNPQDAGLVQGAGLIFLSRLNNTRQHVREFRASLTPGSATLTADAFSSWVLRATVLNDLTAAVPGGRVVDIKGTLPTVS